MSQFSYDILADDSHKISNHNFLENKKKSPMAVLYCCRWEVISNFIKQHVPESNKTAKDVLAKAKDLQKNGMFYKMF